MLEAVQKYGLKKSHLHKFNKQIDQFYERVITDRTYHSDLTMRYQSRFKRYRQSLFTFIEYDNIPWNNNMAERAIRHLAVQRKISGSFFKSFAPKYLLMLGITQTCRFQDKSLLKFLMSGEKDIDTFKAAKHLKGSIPVDWFRSPRWQENNSGTHVWNQGVNLCIRSVHDINLSIDLQTYRISHIPKFFREFRQEAIWYWRAINKLYITNLLSKGFCEKC